MHALTGKAVATVVFLAVAIALITGTATAADITNGGFEDSFTGWNVDYSSGSAYPVILTWYPYQGTKDCEIAWVGAYADRHGNVTTASGFYLQAGDLISLNARAETLATDNGKIVLGFIDEYGVERYRLQSGLTTTSYQFFTYTVNASIASACSNWTLRFSMEPVLLSDTYTGMLDNISINYGAGASEAPTETNTQIYEISVVDSMTGALVPEVTSCFMDHNNSTWFNYTASTGQHYAELMANTSYDWYVSKAGYTTYNETFTTAYITYGGLQVNGLKSCTLINMMEPDDTALTYVTFRVTANSRLTGAQVALDDGQSKLTDGDGVAFFIVPKYADYNYQVRYTGYYPYYGTFNLTNSTYIDVHLISKTTSTVTPTPTASPGIPADPPESIDTLLQEYKDFCNSTIEGILNATYEGFNDSAGRQLRSYNDSIVLAKGFLESQYNNSTGYGYIYSEFLGLVFGFIPIEVKAQIAYFFLWVLMLIILGR